MEATESPGVTGPSLGGRPQRNTPPDCRARPQGPGDAIPAAPSAGGCPSAGGKASPSRLLSQKVEGTARVSLGSRPSGSRAEGDTTGNRAEGGRDQSWVPARGHRQERSGRKGLVGGDPRAAGAVGLPVYSAGAQKSEAATAPAPSAPARDSRPHFPLLPAPSLQ